MSEPIFWDIVGPISLILFGATILLSIIAFRQKSIPQLFLYMAVGFMVSYISAWSIGKFLVAVPILQLAGVIYLYVKRNASA